MDLPFDPATWEPTEPTKPNDPSPPIPPDTLVQLITSLNQTTKKLLQHPYDPRTWLARARILHALRYPELAAGDAYKSQLLCSSILHQLAQARYDGPRGFQLGYRCGFWMRDESAPLTPDLPPASRLSSTCSSDGDDGGHDRISALLKLLFSALDRAAARLLRELTKGSPPDAPAVRFVRRAYPWMAPHHRTRSEALIADLNALLARRAPRASRDGGPLVEIRRHVFTRQGVAGSTTAPTRLGIGQSDVLGVFAARCIPAHTVVLVDRTRYFGCNGRGADERSVGTSSTVSRASTTNPTNTDYDAADEEDEDPARGEHCYDPIHPNHAADSTAHDMDWIREQAGTHAADVLLTCRVLLDCVLTPSPSHQSNCNGSLVPIHPLSHFPLASLTPTYPRNPPIATLSPLQPDLYLPTSYLQQLGVDIFTNHAYDSWVLFTLGARISNNSSESGAHAVLHPLFSLFNHSCEPNATWGANAADATLGASVRQGGNARQGVDVSTGRWQDRVGTMVVRTTRDLVAGEQVFVEYDGFVSGKGYKERRARLRRWVDGECGCTRCVREEWEEREAEGEGAAGEGEAAGGEDDNRAKPAWDDSGEVVLPEDQMGVGMDG